MNATNKIIIIRRLLTGCVLACSLTSNIHAQNAGGYAVAESGANYRVWQKTTVENGANRIHRYTELGSGLNYRDPVSGQWRPSREQIDLLSPGGAFAAAATSGQHQASFPLDIAQGIIQLSTPEGKQLTSRPVGLFYEDDSNSVLIAILTNSVGELVGSNQVVYPGAFEGVAASVRYRYTRTGFEQDVIVQGQLPDPTALGLNAARARLGVLTAFFDTNNPVVTAGPTEPETGLSDAAIRFGSMAMAKGRAFSIGDGERTQPPAAATPATWLNWLTNAAQRASSGGPPTFKRWFQLNGRNFLMEEVPYRRVAAQLQQLPPWTGRLDNVSTNLLAADALLDAIPARLLAQSASGTPGETRTMRLSRVDLDKTPALVLDYIQTLSGSLGNYTFQGDTTYLVSGPCTANNVILEGGTVIKYSAANFSWDDMTAYIEVDGTLTCQTSSYHPAVFTAIDDDTAGETIEGSTGNPTEYYYANPAIYAPGGISLTNVCIRYAYRAVWSETGSIALSDAQVTGSSEMAVLGMYGYGGATTLTCNNCLFSGYFEGYPEGVVLWDLGSGGNTCNLTNCTIAGVYYLVYGPSYYNNYGYAVNSIFADIFYPGYSSWGGDHDGIYNCYNIYLGYYSTLTYVYPFQTAGGGNYYLADNSPFRGLGATAGVSPNLLADLQAKTTFPPDTSYVNQTISSDTILQPRSLANTGTPDLGYHYPILDYIVSNTSLDANLTLDAGTVIGWQGQGISFLDWNFIVNFNGTVNHPCYFVRCNTVQEADGSGDNTGIAGSGCYPTVNATFTRFSALGDLAAFLDGNIVWQAPIYNSEFWGGCIGGNSIVALNYACENCLFDRSTINISMTSASVSGDLILQNCTLHGGNLILNKQSTSGKMQADIYDSAFDGTTILVNKNNGSCVFSHNAHLSGANGLPGDQNGKIVSGSYNWQSGPFGHFYLPDDPPAQDGTLLTDAGDRSASAISVTADGTTGATAPLSDFTTQTTEQLDSGPVDIGYHYVASQFITTPIAPQLTTACLSDGIVLNWTYTGGFPIQHFKIYRRINPGGTYNYNSPLATVSPDSHFYVDKTVTANHTYCYLVTFDYYDPFTDTTYPTSPAAPNAPGYSNESCNQRCSFPPLPPGCTKTDGIDVVFIVDNTYSMYNDQDVGIYALDAIKPGILSALSDIVAASGTTPNYRLALITPDNDQVNVRVQFAPNNFNAFKTQLDNLPVFEGYNNPESTDECLNTAANALAASARITNPAGCTRQPSQELGTPLQINDFTPAFRSDARKFIVLITDAPPGGFCDPSTFSPSVDGNRAISYAMSAVTNCMRINAIQVYHPDQDPADTREVMEAYASITSGWYSQLDDQADAVADAIRLMLYSSNPCGCP